jgi:hypothetical protein
MIYLANRMHKPKSYKVNHNRAIDKFKNLERVALRIAA